MSNARLTRREWLAGAAAARLAPAATQKPNLVFLYSDDHHFQGLSANGNPHIRTPNLDRLAARGVLFTNGIVSTPQCCPSRGIMLSGLETCQTGLLSNGQSAYGAYRGPTVVEQLRRAGYETTLVGKWHIQPPPAECGFSRAPLWLRGGSSQYRDPKLRRSLEGADEPVPGHITDLLTDAAIDSMRSARRPFVLWLAYNAPHSPWYADARYRGPYEGKDPAALAPPRHPPRGRKFDWITYYSVITHLDEAVGRLIAHIEKSGLWENTVIFFMGDNGLMCGTRNWTGKVYPWEESVRVPYLAAGGPVKGGVRSEAAVASIDLPATWLDLAGVRPAYSLAGRSLAGALRTGKGGPDAAFAVWDDGRPEALAVKTSVEPYRLVRTRRHKYILWESGKQALFDWQEDPAEERSLTDARLAQSLKEMLVARMKDTGDHARSWLS